MLVKTKKGITICTLFDNETITLDDSLEWSIWLKNVRDLSTSTINPYTLIGVDHAYGRGLSGKDKKIAVLDTYFHFHLYF